MKFYVVNYRYERSTVILDKGPEGEQLEESIPWTTLEMTHVYGGNQHLNRKIQVKGHELEVSVNMV